MLGEMDPHAALLAGEDDVASHQFRGEDRVDAGADRLVVAQTARQQEGLVRDAAEQHVGVHDLLRLTLRVLRLDEGGPGPAASRMRARWVGSTEGTIISGVYRIFMVDSEGGSPPAEPPPGRLRGTPALEAEHPAVGDWQGRCPPSIRPTSFQGVEPALARSSGS